MALWKLDLEGFDEIAKRMTRGEAGVGKVVDEMLKVGGAVLQEEFRAEIKRTFTKHPTGDLAKSIRVGKVKHTTTSAWVEIKPTGKNKHKQDRARIGTVLEYGRSPYKKSGKGRIRATLWVTNTHKRAKVKIHDAMMEVWQKSGL